MANDKRSRRQGLRRAAGLVSLLAFPVTMNWFSPFVSAYGAWAGAVSGSVLLFGGLFVSALFLGRSFCGWVCPAGALQDLLRPARDKRVRKGRWVKYLVWAAWFSMLVLGFVRSWGPPDLDPLLLTEKGVSVQDPAGFVIYGSVLAVFLVVTLAVGRRGACHTICWMAPFLAAGGAAGRVLGLPVLRLRSAPERCTSCGECVKACPMSLNVTKIALSGRPRDIDCILCGECADACPSGVLRYGFGRP